MNYVIGKLSIHGNVAVRTMDFLEVGAICHGHAHNFDHMSLVIHGQAEFNSLEPRADGDITVELDGQPVRMGIVETHVRTAGDLDSFIDIPAGRFHLIRALQRSTRVLCIYANRTPQGDVVQEYCGWPQAYL